MPYPVPDPDQLDAALVAYETGTDTDAKRFSIHLAHLLGASDLAAEIFRRILRGPRDAQVFVAFQAGLETGYRLHQLETEKAPR
jgi:hypothetical protein